MTKKIFRSAPDYDVAAIFAPASMALIGASERDGSLGTVVLKNLLKARYKGRLYPVNPQYKKVQGRRCFASVSDLPKVPDMVLIVTPARTVPGIIEECGRLGVRGAIVISAGFREAGPEGVKLEQKALANARKYGLRFLGPNCLGVMRSDIGLNATFSHGAANQGRIALVSQSGALCTAILDWAKGNGVGFSSVISTGISADVDFGEILDFLVQDSKTDSIMLYVEGLHDSRRFMSALRAAARVKPVIVMKSGRNNDGSKAAASHTGAMVGSDDVFDAALRRAGSVRVHSFAAFFAAALTLNSGVRTNGPRLCIVTNGGGPAVIAADKVSEMGLQMAQLSRESMAALDAVLPATWSKGNPVDVIGDASAQRYEKALKICMDDPGVDAVLAIVTPQAMTEAYEVAERVVELKKDHGKPLFTCWMGEKTVASSRKLFFANNIPSYRAPENAVLAFSATAAYRANQKLLLQVPEPLSKQMAPDLEGAKFIIEEALKRGQNVLNVAESKALLACFHVPILRSMPAREPYEAVVIAEEVGFPVAMKIYSPDITHKSDVGGVRLGLNSGHEVRRAYEEMMERVARGAPDAHVDGVVIEPMWHSKSGRELMVGVVNDAVFGPVISCGLGGTMVEILSDQALAMPPLNRYLVRRMIRSTRAAKYLEEFRGLPAANQRAVEDAILRVSEMVCELPWIEEMDINPLIVDENGVVAVDARVVVKKIEPTRQPYAHMAIHPYPSGLAHYHDMADGTRFLIRPIRPEDAKLEQDLMRKLSDRTRFLRFMYTIKELTPAMLSRFTQIDYDREMALIAVRETPQGEQQVGVARYIIKLDGEGCEFAIVVADELQGKGLASGLFRDLIEVARARGLKYMDGVALRENSNMIRLARDMGFKISMDPESTDMIKMLLVL
jgi:acetyltransferase